jgi:hypothetical protein
MKRIEQIGTGMSLLCAVHCAATPILVSTLPLLGERLSVVC